MRAILDALDTDGPGKSPWDVLTQLNSERERKLEVDFVTDWLKEYCKRGECHRYGNYYWKGGR